mmetsp:Transcript_14201/g.29380  ORF Transcript_14201/g.29380 Transcript_14201/m.29380 type:complete len:217 (-) Transcript_14201:193-843(-)
MDHYRFDPLGMRPHVRRNEWNGRTTLCLSGRIHVIDASSILFGFDGYHELCRFRNHVMDLWAHKSLIEQKLCDTSRLQPHSFWVDGDMGQSPQGCGFGPLPIVIDKEIVNHCHPARFECRISIPIKSAQSLRRNGATDIGHEHHVKGFIWDDCIPLIRGSSRECQCGESISYLLVLLRNNVLGNFHGIGQIQDDAGRILDLSCGGNRKGSASSSHV